MYITRGKEAVDSEPFISLILPLSPHSLSIAPGHYGQLMNSWERPRGIYPVSMAMLDLLLCGFPPEDSAVYGDSLACVVLVMREMFAGSHSWRYRHSANRDQIGGRGMWCVVWGGGYMFACAQVTSSFSYVT